MSKQFEYMVRGTFDIPADMPVGKRLVRFSGSDPNSVAQASYVGDHKIKTETVQTIRTTLIQGVDPLAQTFNLQESRWLGAVDLYFTKIGTKAVRVQLRTVALGMPTEESVTEGYLSGAAIQAQQPVPLNQSVKIRFKFDPVYIEQGTTMALVVLTDDAEHELAIARLGEFDPTGKVWVRAQADQAGVLLSSSNAQAWTVHQEADLKYRLLGLKFDAQQPSMIPVTNSQPLVLKPKDTLMLRATIQRTAADQQACDFRIVGGKQPLALPANSSTQVLEAIEAGQLEVELAGTDNTSPLIYPDLQLQVGRLIDQAVYVSRIIPLRARSEKIVVKFDLKKPSDLKLEDIVQVSFQPVAHGGMKLDDWDMNPLFEINAQACEATMVLTDTQKQAKNVQLKLVLQQPAASDYRPELRNLHVVFHES